MKPKRLPQGFFEQNYGLTGCMKLLRQMQIADRRIRATVKTIEESMVAGIFPIPTAELELDAETFYVVSAAFLKLAALIIDDPGFSADPVYRRIQSVRNHLVAHAYEKPDGVAYSGWGFGPHDGPVLKAGSGSPFVTQGYFCDHADLLAFMERFGANQQGMAVHWEARINSDAARGTSEKEIVAR